MIWGKTYVESNREFEIPRRVFLFVPHKLIDGRWAWLETVDRKLDARNCDGVFFYNIYSYYQTTGV